MAGMLIKLKRSESMKKRLLAVCCAVALPLGLLTFALFVSVRSAPAQPKPAPPTQTAATERALLNQYCVVCHNEKAKKSGQPSALAITLDSLDTANVAHDAENWERVVRMARSGMMPPAGMPRPKAEVYESLITYLESE